MEKRLRDVFNKDNITKFLYAMIGITVLSIIYNAILAPQKIVTGGVGGIAIIVNELTGLNTTIFIDLSNVSLIILSFILIGKKATLRQILGCLMYISMVTFTAPLGRYLSSQLEISLIFIIIVSIIYGVGAGLVYRAGYSTGGFDILTTIFEKKLKKPITETSPILNVTVIIFGAFLFKPVQVMYALLIIYISNFVTNVVLYSVSRNKMVFIISKKGNYISNVMINDMHLGITKMKVHSGLFERRKEVIMCIVHNTQYEKLKHEVLKIDNSAFILANKCFQVSGGLSYSLLPF